MHLVGQHVQALRAEFGAALRVCVVYILEAHTLDEWPMPLGTSPCRHYQPKDISTRTQYALEFARDAGLTEDSYLLVDSIDNSFNAAYAAWPQRFYVFDGNELVFMTDPKPTEGMLVEDVTSFLRKGTNEAAL